MSHPIEIHVNVATLAALKAGSTEHGHARVRPTEEELRALPEDERVWLARYVCKHSPIKDSYSYHSTELRCCSDHQTYLSTTAMTWDAVLVCMRALRADERAREAADRAATEASILAALAAPIEEWANAGGGVASAPRSLYLNSDAQNDPRIIAHRNAIAAECMAHATTTMRARLAELLAAPIASNAENHGTEVDWNLRQGANRWSSPGGILHEQWEAARKARIEQVEREVIAPTLAARAAKDARTAELTRSYVIANVPEFARAAREGLDVRVPAFDATIAEVELWVMSAALELVKVTKTRAQDLPRTLAYERLDAVRASIADRAGDHPLIASIETEIVRGNLAECAGTGRQTRTVIAITIRMIDADESEFTRYVCAEESCAVDPDSGDDDTDD